MGDKWVEHVALAAVVGLFGAVRFAGYWAYVRWLGTRGYVATAAPAAIAATRMLLGLLAGVALTAAVAHASQETLPQVLIGLPAQLVLRVAIWSALVRYFFGRLTAKPVVLGVVTSYVLDVPSFVVGLLGLFVAMRDMRFC